MRGIQSEKRRKANMVLERGYNRQSLEMLSAAIEQACMYSHRREAIDIRVADCGERTLAYGNNFEGYSVLNRQTM